MAKQLEKLYNPKEVEDRTYQFWMNGGYFTAKPDPEKKPYTIVIPPPNITGQLHMGHALDETLQDILIRCPLDSRHRPRLDCNRGEDCGSHAQRRAFQG